MIFTTQTWHLWLGHNLGNLWMQCQNKFVHGPAFRIRLAFESQTKSYHTVLKSVPWEQMERVNIHTCTSDDNVLRYSRHVLSLPGSWGSQAFMSLSPTYSDIIFSCLSVGINTEQKNMWNVTRMREDYCNRHVIRRLSYHNWLDNTLNDHYR